MSFINRKSQIGKTENLNLNLNHEGEPVFLLNPMKTLLVKTLSSFFGQNTFYERRDPIEEYKNLIKLIEEFSEEDKEYALKIAEIGRLSGMREYPLNILSVCYHLERYKGSNFLSEEGKNKLAMYCEDIVRRTKDINHLIAIDKQLYGEKMPSQMKKNLKVKLEGYDQYKLSKGLDRGKVVSLADSIKLLRPRPINEEMALFYKRVIENDVVVGNNKKQVQAEVEKVIIAKKENEKVSLVNLENAIYNANLSALIKNISKYIDLDVFENEEILKYVCKKIKDKNSIIKSKIMPYEFYSTFKALKKYPSSKVGRILKSLNKAIDISIENTPNIEGYSAFLIDLSASMKYSEISNNSSITCLEMACLLGAISYKKGEGDLFVFSDNSTKVTLDKNDSITTMMSIIEKSTPNGITNLDKALKYIDKVAKRYDMTYDNIIMFSDGDCYSNDKKGYTIGEYSNLNHIVDTMLEEKSINSFWLNDLRGNNFSVLNTDEAKKNLIAGYNDVFIDIINLYYNIRSNSDIRPLIDELLEKYRSLN